MALRYRLAGLLVLYAALLDAGQQQRKARAAVCRVTALSKALACQTACETAPQSYAHGAKQLQNLTMRLNDIPLPYPPSPALPQRTAGWDPTAMAEKSCRVLSTAVGHCQILLQMIKVIS